MGNSTSTPEDSSQSISTDSETFYSPQFNRHSFPGPRPTHPADVSTTSTRNSMPPDRRSSLTGTGGSVLPSPSPTFTVSNPRGSSGSTSSAASAAREFRKRFNGSIADQRSDFVSASPFVGSPLTSVDDFGESPTTPTTPTTPTQSSSYRPPSSMLAQPPASAPNPSSRLSDRLNHPDFDNTVGGNADNTVGGNASTADRPWHTGRPRADSIGAPYYDNTRGNSKQQVATERGADPLVISVATPLDDAPADPAVMAEEEKAYRRKSIVVHGSLFPGQDPAGTIGMAPLTATGTPTSRKGIPTIINWTQGGNNVYITGTFNGWKHKIRLVKSTQDFTTVLDLPPGTHRLKFIVDDEWKCSADLETATDPDGNLVNYVEVGDEDDDATDDFVSPRRRSPDDPFPEPALSSTPPGSYNATIPAYLLALATQQSENSAANSSPSQPATPQSQTQAGAQQPPSLPPHLEKVLLNSQAVSEEDNSVLLVPNHVTLNHLYACSIRDGVMAVAGTARYRKKYITTMYYKPVFTN